jgi:hypothetical protein
VSGDGPRRLDDEDHCPTADGRPRSPADHLQSAEVAALIERIDGEQGRLDVLVNDIRGGGRTWGSFHDLAKVGAAHGPGAGA